MATQTLQCISNTVIYWERKLSRNLKHVCEVAFYVFILPICVSVSLSILLSLLLLYIHPVFCFSTKPFSAAPILSYSLTFCRTFVFFLLLLLSLMFLVLCIICKWGTQNLKASELQDLCLLLLCVQSLIR